MFNLRHFETIDGMLSQLLRIDFLTCEDPRGYIRLSNRLFDACVDAGMPFDAPSHTDWAAEYVSRALVSA